MTRMAISALLFAACTTDITPKACFLPEACNGGVDDDCDESTIEGTDADGDGYCAEPGGALPCCTAGGGDCDDSDEAVYPGAKGALACTGPQGDQDGDGHNRLGDTTGGRPPDDCCDSDPDVFPGQTRWFTADDGQTACGNWDYDCNGPVELEFGDLVACTCSPFCSGTSGWEDELPSCGGSAMFSTCDGTSCPPCPTTTAVRLQGCH